MSASAAQIGTLNGVRAPGERVRPHPALTHPPDVLRALYVLARQSPPFLALISLWFAPDLHRHNWFTHLTAESFTVRQLSFVVALMLVWSRFFKLRVMDGRNTPRIRFVTSQLASVFIATAACSLLLWIGETILGPIRANPASVEIFALRCGAAGIACVFTAAVAYSIAYYASRPRLYLILGSRRKAVSAYKRLQHQRICRSKVLGFIDPDNSHARYLPSDYLGSIDCLESILIRHPVDMVFLALPLNSHYGTVQDAIRICERIGVEYSFPPDVFETRLSRSGRSPLHEVRGFVVHMIHEDYRIVLKRALDIACSLLLLCLLAPLLLAIALAVKLTSKGPIFFVQERYGLNRGRFRIYKFRSMVADAEAQMNKVEELNEAPGPIFKIRKDPRITRIGRLLRKSSLDELPQLFNVLKGDMSLVGPRPMSLRDVHRFSESSLMRRFSVLPGITGLWQVSGRCNTDFDTWISLDLHYIDHWSLGLDLRILLRTVPTVLTGRGAV
jgi:exopolysaccharide biosynthesis polyprenyl glycosylphosphotransferase